MAVSTLHTDTSDRSGISWGPCPFCDDWSIDVVWSELEQPLTYAIVVLLVEQAMADHFAAEHPNPTTPDGSLLDGSLEAKP